MKVLLVSPDADQAAEWAEIISEALASAELGIAAGTEPFAQRQLETAPAAVVITAVPPWMELTAAREAVRRRWPQTPLLEVEVGSESDAAMIRVVQSLLEIEQRTAPPCAEGSGGQLSGIAPSGRDVTTAPSRPAHIDPARRLLLVLAATALVATIALQAAASIGGAYSRPGVQVLLTTLGLTIGALLAAVHVSFIHRFRWWALSGLASIVLSQAGYNVLVWSGWKTQTTPWRLWWVFMVVSLFTSHMVWLRWETLNDGESKLVRWAELSAAVASAAFAALVIRPDLLGHLPWPWVLVIAVAATTTSLCSMALVLRRWRQRLGSMVPARAGAVLLVFSHLVVLLLGLYIGSRGPQPEGRPDPLPSSLAALEPEQIGTQLAADRERLETVVSGLQDLESAMAEEAVGLKLRLQTDERMLLDPREDERLRWHFVTFLSYRTALLRMVTTYSGFQAVRDPDQSAECFVLGYAAAMEIYRSGLALVSIYGDDRLIRRKLNEAEPAWGIPAGMFDRVYEGVSAQRHVELCEEMAAYFDAHRQRWRASPWWTGHQFDWVESQVDSSLKEVRERGVDRHRRWLDLFVDKVRDDAYSPAYAVQAAVANWIGDIRIVDRPRLIGAELIERVAELLEPGDILLERRSWNASNAFLPGFWPHAAMYVGDLADLTALGVLDEPEVASRLDVFRRPAADGHPLTVIEALGEGVIFNSLETSLHADYIAVLRPRLARDELAEVVVRTFRHQGKPYDFEFDFFTSDKLVCTELVYRAFQGLIELKPVRVMGRDTLPALELVHKYARERHLEDRDLDFVLFLDADPASGKAFFADEQAFIESAGRRREFNE